LVDLSLQNMYEIVNMHDTRPQLLDRRQGQYSENTKSNSKIFWLSLRIIQLLVSILVLGLAANGMAALDNNANTS
jgi:hypothetical protein